MHFPPILSKQDFKCSPLQSSIAKTDEEMEDTSDTQSSTDESVPEEAHSMQENTVDSTVNTEQQGEGKEQYEEAARVSL